MKILVTGTAGFIGFHLALKLAKRGDEIVGLDNINDYYDVDLKYGRLKESGILDSIESGDKITYNKFIVSKKYKNYKFIKLDLEDKKNLEAIFKKEKFDAVCNLAAQAGVRYSLENPDTYINSNIVGFMNILECCRNFNVKNLSYASSSSVYGLNRQLPFSTEHNTDHPISIYAATKKSNELMAHTYSHLFGIQTTGIRFFTVYGPWGRPDMAPMIFTKAILNNESIKVFNNGKMSRDFTYIDDIVDGIVKVIDNPSVEKSDYNHLDPDPSSSTSSYKIYNIGNNSPVNLLDFIETLEEKLGRIAKKEYLPIQDGDVVSTFADVDSLINDFDYTPKTSIDIGVDNFVKWYEKFYNKKAK